LWNLPFFHIFPARKSEDANFKAFTRRAQALRGLHRWEDALNDLEDALSIYPRTAGVMMEL